MKEKALYWTPRILTILGIIFMLMFSLDTLGEKIPLSQKLLGLFMQNIPAFILTIILIIAWKHEMTGGVLFIAAFIAASIFYRSFSGNPGSLVVILPFLITGALFIIHRLLYRTPAKKVFPPPSI
jgi:hypothetical protein